MRSVKMLVIMIMVLLVGGCGKPNKEPQPSKAIEDMTGMTAIKQGEQMKKKLKEFEKAEQKKMDEAVNKEE